ncbi:hypothetical protein NM688_g5282 [Phlebia brevispora]|uniref:Uncharacterized protein n=1 Tax=Phlebia brevispora TaxID=194682 RepID=A0ACC1SXL3_9APHY|nr:hypothetical protein NM688_g5282 [Phlebia brevispora]
MITPLGQHLHGRLDENLHEHLFSIDTIPHDAERPTLAAKSWSVSTLGIGEAAVRNSMTRATPLIEERVD